MGEVIFRRIREGALRLECIGAGNPRLESEYLMAAAIGIPRIRLWLIAEEPGRDALSRFDALLARRLAREPLQYVLGSADFAGLTLDIGPGVFIPRSETEALVERVTDRLRGAARPLRLIDVGTGSGAILLSLLARFPDGRGFGIDREPRPLSCAQGNARRLGLSRRAGFARGDLLAGVRPSPIWDAIVSNPPYIRVAEERELAPEIRLYEPSEALFGGEDGLDVVRRLIPEAAARLRAGGLLAIEIGIAQGGLALGLLRGDQWDDAVVEPDLTGRPRILFAQKSGS